MSLALARGFFPRRGRAVFGGMLLAGVLADVDLVTMAFGPAAFFAGRHTATHSIVGTLFVIGIAGGLTFVWTGKDKKLLREILLATSLAASVHVLFDVFSTDGVALLWPFAIARSALDWLPTIDTWILVALIGGILMPEIFRLVGSEIGAKNKAPRGRNGAVVALALILAYVAVRATFHQNATALIEAHSYHGESPRHVGAFAESLSILTWRGVLETQSNVCLLHVPVAGGAKFDPETAACMHKPEDSAALQTAGKTEVAKAFVQAAQFPRASVEKTERGFEVALRDTRDLAEEETQHRVAALISLNDKAQVEGQSFVWTQDVRLR